MTEKKTATGKKYRLLWPKRNENGKQYIEGDLVDLSHLKPAAIDFLMKTYVYKEVA